MKEGAIFNYTRLTNRPFAGYGHMVRNKLRWDANDAVGLPKQRNSYQSSPTFLILEVPLRHLRPSVIYSVPCERILQRAYCTCKFRRLATLYFVARQVGHKRGNTYNSRFNLQCNNVARQVEEKCCPYYRTLYRLNFP